MPRQSLTLVALFAISFMGFMGYSYLTHFERAITTTTPPAAPALVVTQPAKIDAVQVMPASNAAGTPETMTSEVVEKWISEATSDDPKLRAAAIAALATAPKLQALPVLQKALSSGEPVVERPLALSSLRTLALQQGDADGGIRNVLRQAIYHGDDAATTQGAQATLDDLEEHLSQGTTNANP